MMTHEKIKILLSAYTDNELNETEKSLVEDHLLACPQCQSAYKEYIKLKVTLNQWSDETLSPDVSVKLNKALSDKLKERDKMNPSNQLLRVGVGSSLIVVLLLSFVASQIYYKRGLQGRLKMATDDIGNQYQIAANKPAGITSAPSSQPISWSDVGVIQPESTIKLKADLDQSKQVGNKQFANVRSFGFQGTSYNAQELSKKEFTKDLSTAVGAAKAPAEYEPYYLESSYAVSQNGIQSPSYSSAEMVVPGRYEEGDKLRDEEWYRQNPVGMGGFNTENYSPIVENEFLTARENPLSTFSIDVDTASYSNIRRFLNNNQMPPQDAVRIEEMINYFTYDYPKPFWNDPFSITTDIAQAPWNPLHKLIRVGLQGKIFEGQNIPPSNLVFLIDSSGSMNNPNKMPLLKTAFKMMTQQLRPQDHVAIVTYAGAAGLVLDSTEGANKYVIESAINNLSAGGSTAGGAGIQLAYEVARRNFIKGGNNRVILATDGDFNVGVSSDAELVRMIEEKRKQGVFLTVLGFGTGNYKDNKMEQLADKGNGNFYYIDNENEARKVLVSELGSTIFTIAKDVKIQVEFNPSQVKAYRLIGYENRMLKKEDFNDDTKDAGELGAGHTVTALYEVIPAYSFEPVGNVDQLKYQKQISVRNSDEIMTVKLRYKEPNQDRSRLITKTVKPNDETQLQGDFAFASSVAEFGLILRNSKFKGNASYDQLINRAYGSIGNDPYGYRREFVSLVEKARQIDNRPVNNHPIIYRPEYDPQENSYPSGSGTINFKGE